MSSPPWTPEEIKAWFMSLSARQHNRFRMIARHFIWRTVYHDEKELVHAAYVRLCRTQPRREVALPVLMRETMRSLAHCSRNSAPQRARMHSCEEEEKLLCTVSAEEEVEEGEEKSRLEARNRNAIEQVWRHFAGAPDVIAILVGIRAGKSPSQIRSDAGMTQLQYDNAHRRLRRGLDKLFPERRK